MSSALQYPFTEPPASGHRIQVAPGVHWLHFPLPFSLDHINLWLLEDGDGWTLVDTGFGSRATGNCGAPPSTAPWTDARSAASW